MTRTNMMNSFSCHFLIFLLVGFKLILGDQLKSLKDTSASASQDDYYNNNFCMGRIDHMYRNPLDCTTYFHCVYGNTYLQHCPIGNDGKLHFIEETQECDWSDKSNCKELNCAEQACGTFPVPGDCRSFYTCNEFGELKCNLCPSLLYFNPILMTCDLPENSNCV